MMLLCSPLQKNQANGDRRRPRIAPVQTEASLDWAHELVADGRARWSGGKPAGLRERVPVTGRRTVSAAVLEDRS
jgi:hypothetical protein